MSGRFPMIGLLAAGLLFLGLALWQLQRGTEKRALIDAVESRVDRPPSNPPGPGACAAPPPGSLVTAAVTAVPPGRRRPPC